MEASRDGDGMELLDAAVQERGQDGGEGEAVHVRIKTAHLGEEFDGIGGATGRGVCREEGVEGDEIGVRDAGEEDGGEMSLRLADISGEEGIV